MGGQPPGKLLPPERAPSLQVAPCGSTYVLSAIIVEQGSQNFFYIQRHFLTQGSEFFTSLTGAQVRPQVTAPGALGEGGGWR